MYVYDIYIMQLLCRYLNIHIHIHMYTHIYVNVIYYMSPVCIFIDMYLK